MVQVKIICASDQDDINKQLQWFQDDNPKAEIISVSVSNNSPVGWFVTIAYKR